MRWDRKRVARGFGVALGLAVAAQVLPFLLPFEPGPLPPEAQALEEAERYVHPLPSAALARRITSYLGLGLVLVSGLAVGVERRWGPGPLRWPARLLCLAAVYAWLWVLGLPYSIVRFLHMRGFGLTDLTLSGWGKVVTLGLPLPFITFLMAYLLIYCCLPLLRRRWWVGAALLVLVFFHLLPELMSRDRPIDPVETLTPLETGPHHHALTNVAASAGAELTYFTVDQSERSNQVNMHLTGRLGREYVVLTDTLFALLTPGEAAVVLAHELGHDETRKIAVPAMKILSALKLLLALWMVHLVLGRAEVPADRRLQALVLVMLSVRVFSLLSAPATSALVRYREREADRYALELTNQPTVFAQAVLKMAEANLEPYEPPRAAYWLSGTHPSVKERLAVARTWTGP